MVKGVVQEPNLVLLTSSYIREDDPYTQGGHIIGWTVLLIRERPDIHACQ